MFAGKVMCMNVLDMFTWFCDFDLKKDGKRKEMCLCDFIGPDLRLSVPI